MKAVAEPIRWLTTTALATIPLASLGLLSPLPLAVVAVRRRRRGDLATCAGMTAACLLWWLSLAEWENGGHGPQFAVSTVLLLINTAGATALTLTRRIDRPRPGRGFTS
jgi:hypothetical protein